MGHIEEAAMWLRDTGMMQELGSAFAHGMLEAENLKQEKDDWKAEYEASNKERYEAEVKSKELQTENKKLKELYNDLLYQVQSKYPDESRHETAKRIIRQSEQGSSESEKTLKDGLKHCRKWQPDDTVK